MSQSELRNFEKSMAYHLAPAMLGIKPACLMSMEKNKDGLEENVELFNSRAYTKGMKLTVLCECKSRKLLFLYNEKLCPLCTAGLLRRICGTENVRHERFDHKR